MYEEVELALFRSGMCVVLTLELFRFESGLFGLMMDKTSVIDVS